MATTLYFSNVTAEFPPTDGSKSTALPDGTDNSLTVNDSLAMFTTTSGVDTTTSITTLAQLERQSGRFARFTSARLSEQTISANTWNYQLRNRRNNANANAYKAGSIYVWRPATNTLIGYVYDSSVELGTAWTASYTNDSTNITGSSVVCQSGDVLVCEVWYTAAQAKAASYVLDIQYNTSSFIETPQDLEFLIPTPETSFAWIID